MFGWRKRNDGFEWREYVRTTVLARRQRRRDKVEELKQSAVDGALGAGQAGLAISARGAAAAGAGVRRAVRAMGSMPGKLAASPSLSRAADGLGRYGLAALAFLQSGPLHKPLAALAIVCAAAGPARIVYGGLDATGIVMLVIAAFGLFVYLAPRAGQMPRGARDGGAWRDRAVALYRDWAPDGLTPTTMVAVGVIAATLLLGSGWLAVNHGGNLAALVGVPAAMSTTLTGRAVAVSGDQLRIGRTTVQLDGIEAPERDQTCALPGGKTWRCGQAAAQAMARMLRGTLITCQVSEADGGLLARGSCRVAGTDLAKELVRSGHVFASDGARAHAKLERGAREAKLGLWRGDAERPSIYRAKRWEEARKSAPSGCPIKGQITADGGRVYLLPWSPRYERAKIQSSRGGRWFCSEAEAQAAGWKSGQRS